MNKIFIFTILGTISGIAYFLTNDTTAFGFSCNMFGIGLGYLMRDIDDSYDSVKKNK